MATAQLNFDLSNPDDLIEFTRANKSLDMALALWEIVYNTKKKFVWEVDAMENVTVQDMYDLVDNIYLKINEILNDNDVNIDKLVV